MNSKELKEKLDSLRALVEATDEQLPLLVNDIHSEYARDLLRKRFEGKAEQRWFTEKILKEFLMEDEEFFPHIHNSHIVFTNTKEDPNNYWVANVNIDTAPRISAQVVVRKSKV